MLGVSPRRLHDRVRVPSSVAAEEVLARTFHGSHDGQDAELAEKAWDLAELGRDGSTVPFSARKVAMALAETSS